MGRKAEKPKDYVFTFRADEETAILIMRSAVRRHTVSDFLLEAATDLAKRERDHGC